MNPRRLYRSRDRQLAGVAGGMAEYLDIDPTVVRILWIVAGFLSAGLAIFAYLILALVVPQAPYGVPYAAAGGATGGWAAPATPGTTGWAAPPAAPAWTYQAPQPRPRAETRGIGAGGIVGIVLIVLGAIALADVSVPGWIGREVVGPAVILALGAALLVASVRKRVDQPEPAAAPQGEAHGAGPAPEPQEPVAAATWDVTDTQAVDPSILGSTGTGEESSDPTRPA